MNKYLRAISSNYFFFFTNTIFFLITTAIAIQIMGEELYGLWAILNAIMLFSNIGMIGMGSAVNKFASESGENAIHPNAVISTSLLILLPMAIIITTIIIVLRGQISAQFKLVPQQEDMISLALIFTGLSIIPQFLGRIPHGYLLSQLKNNLARTVELCITIFTWLGVIIIAYTTKNIVVMTIWGMVVQTVGAAVLFAIIIRMINFRWNFDKQAIYRMLSFSGFSLIENLAIIVFQQFDRILVGFILGPTAAGAYSVGSSIAVRLPILAGQSSEVMIPFASLKSNIKNYKILFNTFRELSKVTGVITGTIASILIIWMNIILELWISHDYAIKYTNVFRVLIIAYAFISLVRSSHETLIGLGKVKITAFIYFLSSAIMITGVYVFTSKLGLIGAALANLSMILLMTFNVIVYLKFATTLPIKMIIDDLGYSIMAPIAAYCLILLFGTSSYLYCFLFTIMYSVGGLVELLKTKVIKTQIQDTISTLRKKSN